MKSARDSSGAKPLVAREEVIRFVTEVDPLAVLALHAAQEGPPQGRGQARQAPRLGVVERDAHVVAVAAEDLVGALAGEDHGDVLLQDAGHLVERHLIGDAQRGVAFFDQGWQQIEIAIGVQPDLRVIGGVAVATMRA